MKTNSWIPLIIFLLLQITGRHPLFPANTEPVCSDTCMIQEPGIKQYPPVAHTVIPSSTPAGGKEKIVIEVEIDDKGEVYHSAATPSHMAEWPKLLMDLFCGFIVHIIAVLLAEFSIRKLKSNFLYYWMLHKSRWQH